MSHVLQICEEMASVASSKLVSRSSATGSDRRFPLGKNGMRNKRMSYSCGLRPVNKLDLLQLRTNAKAGNRQLGRKASKTETARTFPGVIKCGMNLVFVGAEVGPWSKTGGLGDVLGGLPPAMAVRTCCLCSGLFLK